MLSFLSTTNEIDLSVDPCDIAKTLILQFAIALNNVAAIPTLFFIEVPTKVIIPTFLFSFISDINERSLHSWVVKLIQHSLQDCVINETL